MADPSPPNSGYAPRRSNRVAADLAAADGDTWREKITVCESLTPAGQTRLVIRSYFKNSRTGDKHWDEPPSGASNIRYADNEERESAEQQRQEMQLMLQEIPADPQSSEPSLGDKKNKKKGGLLSLFRKKEKYPQVDESQDLHLQRALARSMLDQHGSHDAPTAYYDPNASTPDDDEALAMALSLSEAAQQPMSEEEMFMRAIAASQREAEKANAAVARLPSTSDLLDYDASPPPSSTSLMGIGLTYSSDFEDFKMPATTDSQPNSNSSLPANHFDPYAPSSLKAPPHSFEESLEEKKEEPKSNSGRRSRLFGGRKKALQDEAGLL